MRGVLLPDVLLMKLINQSCVTTSLIQDFTVIMNQPSSNEKSSRTHRNVNTHTHFTKVIM